MHRSVQKQGESYVCLAIISYYIAFQLGLSHRTLKWNLAKLCTAGPPSLPHPSRPIIGHIYIIKSSPQLE